MNDIYLRWHAAVPSEASKEDEEDVGISVNQEAFDATLPSAVKVLAEAQYQNTIIFPFEWYKFMKLIDELKDTQEATHLQIHLIETLDTSSYLPTLPDSLEGHPYRFILSQLSIQGFLGHKQHRNQSIFKRVASVINFFGGVAQSQVGGIRRLLRPTLFVWIHRRRVYKM
jgi:hypothetical protein